MALYAKAAGGNWSAAGTWSSTGSGGADNSGPPVATDDVIFEAGSGNVTIDTSAATCKTISCIAGTGSYTGTLTHNSFNWAVKGSITFSPGMTYTPISVASRIVWCTAATGTLITAGKLLWRLTPDTSSTCTLGDNLSFIAAKDCQIDFQTITSFNMNGKTIAGNSAINRLLICTSAVGLSRTITNATTNFQNCDYRDIAFSSASNLDLSAITGLSGDCGGNSITGGGTTLTFTPSATQTWSGTSGGNWSANAWSGRVPLPQDDVVINAAFSASQTIAHDMPRLGRNIDFTGTTGNPTINYGSTSNTLYGSLTYVAGLTIAISNTRIFEGRGTSSITTAGLNVGAVTIQMVGGIFNMTDTVTTSNTWTHSNGTFNTNNFTLSVGAFNSFSGSTRTLNFGSSNIFLTRTTAGTAIQLVSAGLTFNPGTSIMFITGTTAAAAINLVGGAGILFGSTTISSGGLGSVVISGSSTYSNLTIISPNTVTFTSLTTQTIGSFVCAGSSGSLITLNASSAGTFATISQATGIVAGNGLIIQDIHAVGGATFNAANSTNVSGNTGWNFFIQPILALLSVILKSPTIKVMRSGTASPSRASLQMLVNSPRVFTGKSTYIGSTDTILLESKIEKRMNVTTTIEKRITVMSAL